MTGEWAADGADREVAPLHARHADDEARHVVSGALRFRFTGRQVTAPGGATVPVPAGTPHTFGNAGPWPSRFITTLPRPAGRADQPAPCVPSSGAPAEIPEV
ncbi:MAG: cupin domain-containing protein [Streptosporangiaceae bacterium]